MLLLGGSAVTAMDFFQINERPKAFTQAVSALGGNCESPRIADPINEASIQLVESDLKTKLPLGFRSFLLQHSRRVEFSWFLPDGMELGAPLSGIFSGGNMASAMASGSPNVTPATAMF